MRISRYLPMALVLLTCISCKNRQTETLETYVVMVSFDGFRWDYADLYNTPNFEEMASNGVKAERLIPSFPTKTFPNHYSLATGLYPDNHGIINNSFYAPDLDGIYRIGDRDMVSNPDAYFGEPIWVTAEEQGVKSASYYWVGSEAPIKGSYPSYWKKYDGSVPYMDRVDQVIEWLKLPVQKRPGLITLYFDEPDGTGHEYGPVHDTTGEVVEYLDSVLGYLRSEIAALEYGDRVNLIVLSDHGMGPIYPDRYVNLYDVINEEWIEMIVGGNPVYLVDAVDGFEASVTSALNGVVGVSSWQKDDIPEHFHYGNSPRFPDILVVADSTWSIGNRTDASGYAGGAHGYDNAFTDMHTIFFADGPAFKDGYTHPVFPNVDVYGIIAYILELDPAATDGDMERVKGMFSEGD
ncbi:MAG: alkaline phosphatase family protein [Bacteroidales bacterium]|nr:alkaline phosphatase family protein [Bacteroidales bacterium]